VTEDQWNLLMEENHWKVVDLRDRRYDAVIHLVTAAIGAEQFYTTENNAARTEGVELARKIDGKILVMNDLPSSIIHLNFYRKLGWGMNNSEL